MDIMKKEEFLSLVNDVNNVAKEIPDIVENQDNCITIISWLEKMLIKLEENLKKFERLKNE